MTFRLQEPEAPFQNATSRNWQKAFNPQRELGAFCSGVMDTVKIMEKSTVVCISIFDDD